MAASKAKGWSNEIGEAKARKDWSSIQKEDVWINLYYSKVGCMNSNRKCFDEYLASYKLISPPNDHGGSRRNASKSVRAVSIPSRYKGYFDSDNQRYSSVPPDKFQDRTSNYAKAASFFIISTSSLINNLSSFTKERQYCAKSVTR